jgi:peptidoglycan/xylan/chitin deacetylase (PgdA/CDA1 family)
VTRTHDGIPVLLTLDVHSHPRLADVLRASSDLFLRAEEHVTYFVPAGLVKGDSTVGTALREIASRGHTVGCHGLHHTADEDPRRMSLRQELDLLKTATRILEDALGREVLAYRAPGFRLSYRTLSLLAHLGYKADLSVTPQRFSLISSCPWAFGWMIAPRSPYFPNRSYPYRRGDVRLTEIPTSSLILPLAHGVIANLGGLTTRLLIKMLCAEARHFDRAVVAMFHPEGVIGESEPWKPKLNWRAFIPSRVGGFGCRFYFLLERDAESIQRRTSAALSLLREEPRMVRVSVEEFLASRTAIPGSTGFFEDLRQDPVVTISRGRNSPPRWPRRGNGDAPGFMDEGRSDRKPVSQPN